MMTRSKQTAFIVAAAVIAALAYLASPYIAVGRFARDLEARNAEAVNERIDLPKLRQSIARQVARAFLAKNPDLASKSPLGPQAGAMLVGGFVNAYLAETFTPQAIEAVLFESRAPPALGGQTASVPSLSQLKNGMALLRLSGFDGLTSFQVQGPASPDGSIGFGFRLNGTTWRLTSLDLPRQWTDRLIEQIATKLPSPS